MDSACFVRVACRTPFAAEHEQQAQGNDRGKSAAQDERPTPGGEKRRDQGGQNEEKQREMHRRMVTAGYVL